MKNTIEEYLKKHSDILNLEFDKIKKVFNDSDVKGGLNENIIAEFIREHYKSNFTSIGVEIIDSYGNHTDEIDVCVCNEYQPFNAKYGQPFIAEGIDFVIQVKKTITSQEIDRIKKNCSRLKVLKRVANEKDKFFGEIGDADYLLERIPYIIVAVDSQLTLPTIAQKFKEEYGEKDYELQPDAIYVLNRGFIINFREGKGRAWRKEGIKMKGYCIAHSEDKTLFELIRYIHSYIPKTQRLIHPLNNYFSGQIKYKIE